MASSDPEAAAPHERVAYRVSPARFLDDLKTIKAAETEHLQALLSMHSMDTRLRAMCGYGLTQLLVDEAALRVEHERICQVRDRYSNVPVPEADLIDPALPPWFVHIEGINPAVINVQGHVEIPENWTAVAGTEQWSQLRTRVRAWAVNDLIRTMLRPGWGNVYRIRLRDLVDAANGDPGAWDRLQAACQAPDGAGPAVDAHERSPSTPPASSAQDVTPTDGVSQPDAGTPMLKGRAAIYSDMLKRGRTPREIAGHLKIETKSAHKRIGEYRRQYGADLFPYRRSKS